MSLLLLGSFPGKKGWEGRAKTRIECTDPFPNVPTALFGYGVCIGGGPHLHQYLRRWNQQPSASGGRQPRRNGLDVLNIRYALHDLQHRWLFRDTPLDLQQDRSLPVVQLHDLVVFHNRICECCLIACLHSICEEA